MQANNEKKNLEYCRYYHGESECPYRDSFKGRAWIAEQLASERASDSAMDFLTFVAAHISKWEPYGYEPDVARYIAFFEHCSLAEKIEISQGFAVGEALQFKKPRGRIIFESHSDAGFYTPETIDVGVLLYNDGNVYVKNAVPECRGRLVSLQGEPLPSNQLFFYAGKFVDAANAIEELIKEHWDYISALPSKINDDVCDGGFSCYKFLSKRFNGMIYGQSEDSKAVAEYHDKVLNIFYRTNTPSYDWLETTTDAETFVEKWGAMLDEIDADEIRAKVYNFVGSERFAEDSRNLGFEMDAFESFYKHCNYDLEKGPKKPFEELLAVCSDYHVLGNAIFSQWRYYSHWAYDVRTEFNTNWFRLAFKKLKKLSL